jgi:hypothetical protein
VLPALAGITGRAYLHPAELAADFRIAVLIAGALCAAGGLLAAATITNPPKAPVSAGPPPQEYMHCGLDARCLGRQPIPALMDGLPGSGQHDVVVRRRGSRAKLNPPGRFSPAGRAGWRRRVPGVRTGGAGAARARRRRQ